MRAARVKLDREAYPETAARWLADVVGRTIAARGSCSLALAGGSTPQPVYRALAAPPFDRLVKWKSVHVYFGDERAVPPSDPDSNFGAAREALLERVPIPEAQIHRMEAERADREVAAVEYGRLLPERLDVLILGMGGDGHTASLFPGSPALDERQRPVVAVIGPKAPAARLTITPPVIAAAQEVAVLVTGAGKAAMVARALEGPVAPKDLPAQLARGGTWFLDHAAASGLAE